MARMPPTERAVRVMLRQIGLGAALDSGRFDQVSLDWFVSLLRDTHTMRNDFAAAPQLISPICGLNEEVLLSARLLAEIHAPVYFLWGWTTRTAVPTSRWSSSSPPGALNSS